MLGDTILTYKVCLCKVLCKAYTIIEPIFLHTSYSFGMMHKKKNKLELHYLCIYGLDSVSQKLLAVEGLIYCDHALSDFELDLQF